MSTSFVLLTRTNGETLQVAWPEIQLVVDANTYRRVYTKNQTRNADPWHVTETLADIITAVQALASAQTTYAADAPFATATLVNGLDAAFLPPNVADIRPDADNASACYAYVNGIELPFHVALGPTAFRNALNLAYPYSGLKGLSKLLAVIAVNGATGAVTAVSSAPGFDINAAATGAYTPGSGVYDVTMTGLGAYGVAANLLVQEQVVAAATPVAATACAALANNRVGVTYKNTATGAAAEPTVFAIYVYTAEFF